MRALISTLLWRLEILDLVFRRRQLVFCSRVLEPPDGQLHAPEGFEFRFVAPHDLEALQYPGGWLTLTEARQWLERGVSQMLAGILDSQICSYLWVERRIARIDFADLHAPLPAGHIYISKVLVTRQWRRHGLAQVMYDYISCHDAGSTAHSACVTEKCPVHLMLTKLQWQPRLVLTFWGLYRLRWYFLKPPTQRSSGRFLRKSSVEKLLFSCNHEA
jgi:GNAT superfamily N-acetyltransferase